MQTREIHSPSKVLYSAAGGSKLSFGPVECVGFLALVVGISIPIFLLVRGVTVIPEGQVAVVERRGRFTRVLHAGQHLLLPGGEQIRALVPLQDIIYDTGPQNVLLKDLAELQLGAVVQYHIARQPVSDGTRRWHEISSDAVYHAVYSSENWQEATQAAARATLGESFALLDLRSDVLSVADWQEKVAAQVKHRLNEKT